MAGVTERRVQRRLAAILAADVVGYSGLMGKDEEGTLRHIKRLRHHVFEPKVREHGGRVVKTTGDGMLVEFPSPLEAVRCAIEVQQAIATEGTAAPREALNVRIGINLGDIIIEDDGDIYGDGVNIAARLEELAEPGGILVSRKVYDEVQGKLPNTLEDRGEQLLKNVARPVGVFAVLSEASKDGSPPVGAAFAPSKPTLAVLPFANHDRDPDQNYLSDGFTADIVTELSRFAQLSVISWNTSFQFRGQGARATAHALGVQFILEGSLRRIGTNLRISCQLSEAGTGNQIWAERFDREVEEIFAVQDELVRTIVATMIGRLQAASAERAMRKPPKSLAAYECVLRGNALPMGDPRAEAEARLLYRRAIDLDPTYGRAYAKLAHYVQLEWFRDMNAGDDRLNEALEIAKRSVALAPNDPVCLNILGWVHLHRREFAVATRFYERALELNPNDPEQVSYHGTLHTFLGEPDQALSFFMQARRLDRFYDPPWYWPFQGIAHFTAGRFEPAISGLNLSPTMPTWVDAYLAASHALLGDTAAAEQVAKRLLRSAPDFSRASFTAKEPYRRPEHRELLASGLAAAGLPE